MITGANEYVTLMDGLGAGPLPPGVTCPPGANYCEGKSNLSPADLARVQQENAALQIQSAKSNTRTDTLLAVAAVALVGGGLAYALHRKG